MSASVLAPFRPSQRRAFRLAEPRQQLRLAFQVLGLTSLFAGAAAWNSYTAYAPLLGGAVSAAPDVWGADLVEQTRHYLVVSAALAVGYGLTMIGASVAFVHRMAGPMVALRRHVNALQSGNYASRVTLRGDSGAHVELARQLNDLAAALDCQREKQHTA